MQNIPIMPKQNFILHSKKKRAVQLYQNQQLQQARPILEEICKKNRTDFESFYMLGSIYGQLNLFDEAEKHLRHALKLKPDFQYALDTLGLVLFMLGKHDDAVQMFKAAVSAAPDFLNAHYNLGNALKEMNRYEEATTAYRRVIVLNPRHFDAQNNLGVIYYMQDNNELAIKHLCAAMDIKNDEPGVYRNLYKAYYKTGDLRKAVSMCKRLTELEPDNEENFLQLAVMRNDQGWDEETEKLCLKAIEIREDFSKAYDLMAISHLSRGSLNEARKIYNRLSTMQGDPRNMTIAATGLADIKIKEGKYVEAYNMLSEVLEKGELTPHGSFLMGRISKHIGRQEDAIKVMTGMIDSGKARFVSDLKHLHFGLADLYDVTGQYDLAFEQYSRANQLIPYPHDAARLTSVTDTLIDKVDTRANVEVYAYEFDRHTGIHRRYESIGHFIDGADHLQSP